MPVFQRKRDLALYYCNLVEETWPRHEHLGPCYILRPKGFSGRTHYKTVAAFEQQFRPFPEPASAEGKA